MDTRFPLFYRMAPNDFLGVCTTMVVGFVNSGLMSLTQGIGVITPAIKYPYVCHSGESRNPAKFLDAGSSPA